MFLKMYIPIPILKPFQILTSSSMRKAKQFFFKVERHLKSSLSHYYYIVSQLTQIYNVKHMKYLLVDDIFFSLKLGTSPFDWSLFTDTKLKTREPVLSLMTQREKEKNIYR